jgi:hypothetical protein
MIIEIEASGIGILFDLLHDVEAGASNRVPGGATIALPELPSVRTADATTRLSLSLQCGLGVDAGVTGSWLYEKLKGRARKLWINKAEVRIDRAAITQSITANKLR